MIYNITPIPKPRMTISDSRPYPPKNYKGKEWPRRCVQRYRNFKDLVAMNHVDLPAIGARVIFVLPMPEGWSKAKKESMNNRYHQRVPDLDNLQKALFDAIYSKDCIIADIHVAKKWGYEGAIIIN